MSLDPPDLQTARLRVRRLAEADREPLAEVLGERRDAWLDWTIASYDRLAELHQPPYGERAVERLADGKLVGLVGYAPCLAPFHQIAGLEDGNATGHRPEVGLFWQTAAVERGQGYAAEAAQALVGYGFDELGLGRIVATTEHNNLASIAVMRKIGMTIAPNPLPEPEWFQVVGWISR